MASCQQRNPSLALREPLPSGWGFSVLRRAVHSQGEALLRDCHALANQHTGLYNHVRSSARRRFQPRRRRPCWTVVRRLSTITGSVGIQEKSQTRGDRPSVERRGWQDLEILPVPLP
jgi:hypothetical protein